jgi:hypothetical protein
MVDHGIELEPFNLNAEREAGEFDKSGFYTERRRRVDHSSDAWLQAVDENEKSKVRMPRTDRTASLTTDFLYKKTTETRRCFILFVFILIRKTKEQIELCFESG